MTRRALTTPWLWAAAIMWPLTIATAFAQSMAPVDRSSLLGVVLIYPAVEFSISSPLHGYLGDAVERVADRMGRYLSRPVEVTGLQPLASTG